MFKAWRVSHAERREEREAAGEDDDEEEDTPVVIPRRQLSYDIPKGNPGADAVYKSASDRRQSGPEQ